MSNTITRKRLKELLDYEPNTGIFTWKVTRGSARAGGVAGHAGERIYVHIAIDGRTYSSHRLAWLYVNGYFPEGLIDHIDRNPSNNRINNLREVSITCNMRNRNQNTDNKSGVKGVSWHKLNGWWQSLIRINGKKKSAGSSEDFTEAVAMRLAAEQCVGWSGCESSSPAFVYMQEYCRKNK